ncbi:general stress protein [Planomicrobium sp. YIM 101495]|uniref:general stress protein n=1 Tax=Planomicrobium sp. YIM 101495 TaxID=2665160 RepID=UPI0012B7347E|nr:general stress protein [Planomicrobium sp. YIM 101495]MTD30962.1 hypothetical protein [Planomicrobium sp. YIM 101495]
MVQFFAETFEDEHALVKQINRMKAEGYVETDMFVLAKQDERLTFVRRNSEVEDVFVEDDWKQRFSTALSGNESLRETMRKMEISDDQAEHIREKVEGGHFFLYANRNYAERSSGDRFMLGEKEKTELQNEQVQQGETVVPEHSEKSIVLDERHYEDPEMRRDKRRADPISKPDEKNFI